MNIIRKIKSALKEPSTYVILVIGVIVAFAFGRFLTPLKSIASQLPGSDAKAGK